MAWYTSHQASSTTSPIAGRPRLVETTAVGPTAFTQAHSSPNTKGDNHRAEDQDRVYQARSMPSAPIAQVLNNEANMLCTSQSVSTAFTSATAPFSGRLVDLLLDSDEHSRQRRDQEQQYLQPDLGCSPSVIKLPRLPQPPKRTAKRPRIPPLLQGLHQPPPLPPEGRLFPPITGENSAFPRSAGQRNYDPFFEETTNKQAEEHALLDGNGGEPTKIVQDGENPSDPKVASWPASSGTVGPHDTSVATSKAPSSQKQSQGKTRRQRNRWSEQETKDLLLGVNKYGIGNWKKILQDPAFEFTNRSAVDLKDRFRVCCPGEGLKPRQAKYKEDVVGVSSGPSLEVVGGLGHGMSNSGKHEQPSGDTAIAIKPTGQQQKSARTVIPDLAEMGIRKPFVQNTRRPRRAFSACDDMNLLKGFERYGLVWHSMRDDTELGFSGRHPTDLRDRFRIKYPDKYVKAGNKLKSKEEQYMAEQPPTHGQDGNHQNATQLPNAQNPTTQLSQKANVNNTPHNWSSTEKPINTSNDTSSFLHLPNDPSSLRMFAPLSSFLSHPLLPPDLDHTSDDVFLENVDNSDESPITLNRDILRWANTNPSSLFAMAPAPVDAKPTPNHATTAAGERVVGGTGVDEGGMQATEVRARRHLRPGNGGSSSLLEADAVWLSEKSVASERLHHQSVGGGIGGYQYPHEQHRKHGT